MKKAIVSCGVVGLALTVGAQASMPGHAARPADGKAGVAARIRQLEDLEAVRATARVQSTVEFDLVVQQIWRSVGTYPFAQQIRRGL